MLDIEALRVAVDAHGRVARIVIAAHDGSTPREVGASMLVWADGQSGTIGGGALEHEATLTARKRLAHSNVKHVDRIALGPTLGQCCGGAVTLLCEMFDATLMPVIENGIHARAVDGRDMPLAVKRVLAQARGEGRLPSPQLLQGWFIEPLSHPQRHIWIWGAGHVGRAIVSVLEPFPDIHITWIDVSRERFPEYMPPRVTSKFSRTPESIVAEASPNAEHLILTFSHTLDLALCHTLLQHGFASCGLIGSETKWARFRSKLGALGHSADRIARIQCPIGDPTLGKHPQAIAIGVAQEVLRPQSVIPAKGLDLQPRG
jgi:xanthine dehydrogenase accessory factor